MLGEDLKVSLVENGIAELHATGTKPLFGAVGIEETILGSLRLGFGRTSAWSRNEWNSGVAGENTFEKHRDRYGVVLKATAVMDHSLL
jgi:hypothetical protein